MSTASSYYVYILASRHHGTIYVGVTNDIRLRLELHRSGRGSKFVYRYRQDDEVARIISLQCCLAKQFGPLTRSAAR